MATVSVPMDDAELFAAATAPGESPAAPETPAATPEPPAEPGGQPRDEQGRFAARQPAEPAEPTAPGQPGEQPADEPHAIPPWRLNEVTQERNDLRQRLEETRNQNAAFAHQLRQLQQHIAQANARP